MAVDAVTTAPIEGGLSSKPEPGIDKSPEAGSDPAGKSFDQALAAPKGTDPAGAAPQLQPASPDAVADRGAASRIPASVEAARPGPAGDSLGHQILNRIEAIHQADADLRMGSEQAAERAPAVKVAAQLPGPAEAHPAPSGSDAAPAAGEGLASSDYDAKFKVELQQMQQTSDQAVQADVLSKTVSSLTGSLNKIISSQ